MRTTTFASALGLATLAAAQYNSSSAAAGGWGEWPAQSSSSAPVSEAYHTSTSSVNSSSYYVEPTSSAAWTTEVVTAYTTYCPKPTTFAVNNQTYTVHEATTITITSCSGGCTVSKPKSEPTPSSKAAPSWTWEPESTTEVVTAYTTYCPKPTSFAVNNQTYTVTEATTITIQSCHGGCTISKPVYTTEVVPSYTTYCPNPTTFSVNNQTYTVSKPTTVTISSCPGGCTISKPASTKVPVSTTPGAPYTTPAAPYTTPAAPIGTGAPATTYKASGGSATVNPAAVYTGAAAQVAQNGFAALALFAGVAML